MVYTVYKPQKHQVAYIRHTINKTKTGTPRCIGRIKQDCLKVHFHFNKRTGSLKKYCTKESNVLTVIALNTSKSHVKPSCLHNSCLPRHARPNPRIPPRGNAICKQRPSNTCSPD